MKFSEKESFERLERLEELAREKDDHYWNLGAVLDEEVNQYDRDSDYSAYDAGVIYASTKMQNDLLSALKEHKQKVLFLFENYFFSIILSTIPYSNASLAFK